MCSSLDKKIFKNLRKKLPLFMLFSDLVSFRCRTAYSVEMNNYKTLLKRTYVNLPH